MSQMFGAAPIASMQMRGSAGLRKLFAAKRRAGLLKKLARRASSPPPPPAPAPEESEDEGLEEVSGAAPHEMARGVWVKTHFFQEGPFLHANVYCVIAGKPECMKLRVDLRPIAKFVNRYHERLHARPGGKKIEIDPKRLARAKLANEIAKNVRASTAKVSGDEVLIGAVDEKTLKKIEDGDYKGAGGDIGEEAGKGLAAVGIPPPIGPIVGKKVGEWVGAAFEHFFHPASGWEEGGYRGVRSAALHNAGEQLNVLSKRLGLEEHFAKIGVERKMRAPGGMPLYTAKDWYWTNFSSDPGKDPPPHPVIHAVALKSGTLMARLAAAKKASNKILEIRNLAALERNAALRARNIRAAERAQKVARLVVPSPAQIVAKMRSPKHGARIGALMAYEGANKILSADRAHKNLAIEAMKKLATSKDSRARAKGKQALAVMAIVAKNRAKLTQVARAHSKALPGLVVSKSGLDVVHPKRLPSLVGWDEVGRRGGGGHHGGGGRGRHGGRGWRGGGGGWWGPGYYDDGPWSPILDLTEDEKKNIIGCACGLPPV